MSKYWLVAVPTDRDISFTRQKLQDSLKGLGDIYDYRFPRLKVGTLDVLMQLSDDLTKMDVTCEGAVKKIKRSYHEMIMNKPRTGNAEATPQEGKDYVLPELKVHGSMTVGESLEDFSWNDSQYPQAAHVQGLAESIMKKVTTAEDELKAQMTAYNEVRTTMDAISRKESGSLLVRPLAEYIDARVMVDREHLLTVLVVIPKKSEKKFVEEYEVLEETERGRELSRKEELARKLEEENQMHEQQNHNEENDQQRNSGKRPLPLCNNIVPRSANKLAEDEEFVLYSILVFKKGLEFVKKLLRMDRYTVRPYKYDALEQQKWKKQKKEIKKRLTERFNYLCVWSKTMFGEIYLGWLHIKAMRCFVESVLRFGLPGDFQAFLIKYNKNKEKTARKELNSLYKHLADPNVTDQHHGDEDNSALTAFGEFFPYVSLDVDLALD